MRKIIKGRLAITHLVFLVINLFVAIDFWQTSQETDTIVTIKKNLVNNGGQSRQDTQQLGTYEVLTKEGTFEVSRQYGSLFRENSTITVCSTKFLGIIKSISIQNQVIPIAFWLYIIFALAAIIISATALCLRKNIDFRSFTAIISGILSIMVIYIIWL